MDTGIYVALSKETGIFRDLDITANNIANMNTSGYQSGRSFIQRFPDPYHSAGK